jgi:ribosomal protein S18 acetylase RimI-like enzyme
VTIRRLAGDEVARVLGSGLGLARLNNENGFYLVAWNGAEPIGHAYLALADPPELQDVSVLPPHRRQGVASALTRAAEETAVAMGHKQLTLTVSAASSAARALYASLGYEDTGQAPRHVKGTIEIRSGPLEVDDTLLTWHRKLEAVDSAPSRSS